MEKRQCRKKNDPVWAAQNSCDVHMRWLALLASHALAAAFALLLPAHKGLGFRVSALLARAFLLSTKRAFVDDTRRVQFT